MKSVAIIGAGPAGLVAAKTFLKHSSKAFRVVVLDKLPAVGGLWAVDIDTSGGMMNPHMPTNLSKYTVSLSDLSWEEVDLELRPSSSQNGVGISEHNAAKTIRAAPMFPKAWQVGRYLATYAKRFIPPDCILLNRRIDTAERIEADGSMKWRLRWTHVKRPSTYGDSNGTSNSMHMEEDVFDYLVVASGIFSEPRPVDFLDLSSASELPVKPIHSSVFRTLSDITPANWDGSGNLLVIGGSMSGVEAAAAVAFHLSSERYSPPSAPAAKPLIHTGKVYHVVSQPVYSTPTFLLSQSSHYSSTHQPVFTPIDLELYELSRRPPGPIVPAAGRMPKAIAEKSNLYVRALIGGDQSDLGSSALVANTLDRPPRVAIHDTYSEFVRSGAVDVVSGRVVEVEPSANAADCNPSVSVTVATSGGDTTTLPSVVGIIHATGYAATSALAFLPADILSALEHDPTCARLPLLLQNCQTSRPEVPGLGFVGFYEGPFWGTLEMQSRLLAEKWSAPTPAEAERHELSLAFEELSNLRHVREGMKSGELDVPQYWLGDYVGVMEFLATHLDIPRLEIPPAPTTAAAPSLAATRTGPLVPARFPDPTTPNLPATSLTLTALSTDTATSCAQTLRFVPRALFRGLLGRWTFSRRLDSFDSGAGGLPSGRVDGVATWHARAPTSPDATFELLYIEEGVFVADDMGGVTMRAARRYVWRYDEDADEVSLWFVKGDGLTVDYLFLRLETDEEGRASGRFGDEGFVARAEHWCDPDNYVAGVEWRFDGVAVRDLGVRYRVRGPRKDYVSETWYER